MNFRPSRRAALLAWIALNGAVCPTTARGDDTPPSAEASEAIPEDRHRFYVGTSLFMLMNVLLPNPPSFYQLNVGWRPTARDSLGLEAITWRYRAPLGIPWGPNYGDPAYDYPGHIRDIGVGVSYQRFWWEGLYTQAHAVPFAHTYYDEDREKIQTGFLLFTTLRAGYHVGLWRDRVFIEPSIAGTWWPVQTNAPQSFSDVESGWPRYFLLEPGLHVGVNL